MQEMAEAFPCWRVSSYYFRFACSIVSNRQSTPLAIHPVHQTPRRFLPPVKQNKVVQNRDISPLFVQFFGCVVKPMRLSRFIPVYTCQVQLYTYEIEVYTL